MTDSHDTLDPDTRAMLALMDTQTHHDRYFKRLGVAGWCIAIVAMIAYGAVSLIKFLSYWQYAGDSAEAMQEAVNQLVPFLGAMGGIGILVALLGAAALMMRTRSASLKQISLRLTNLEDMFLRSSEGSRGIVGD